MGMALVNEAADAAFRRGLRDFNAGMVEQQPQEFAAGIARRADDANGQCHAGCPTLSSTYRATRSGMFTPVGAMLLRNSIVWLTSHTSNPRSGASSRSIASTPPAPPLTASAARRQM